MRREEAVQELLAQSARITSDRLFERSGCFASEVSVCICKLSFAASVNSSADPSERSAVTSAMYLGLQAETPAGTLSTAQKCLRYETALCPVSIHVS